MSEKLPTPFDKHGGSLECSVCGSPLVGLRFDGKTLFLDCEDVKCGITQANDVVMQVNAALARSAELPSDPSAAVLDAMSNGVLYNIVQRPPAPDMATLRERQRRVWRDVLAALDKPERCEVLLCLACGARPPFTAEKCRPCPYAQQLERELAVHERNETARLHRALGLTPSAVRASEPVAWRITPREHFPAGLTHDKAVADVWAKVYPVEPLYLQPNAAPQGSTPPVSGSCARGALARPAVAASVVANERNEFGVGVRISGSVKPHQVSEGEGATLVGIGMAINDYMRSRGASDFNCLPEADTSWNAALERSAQLAENNTQFYSCCVDGCRLAEAIRGLKRTEPQPEYRSTDYRLLDNLTDAAQRFRDAFHYNPGHSDLDNEQPITITVTLGDWRRLDRLLPQGDKASK